jgi:hypothetical protein
LMVTLKSYQR